MASAKHSKRWPNLLACRAAFVEPPGPGDELPPVRIELADGNSVMSDAADVDVVLSRFFGRDVELPDLSAPTSARSAAWLPPSGFRDCPGRRVASGSAGIVTQQ